MKRKTIQRQPQEEATQDSSQGHIISSAWTGPLPPPSTLEGFEAIVPGSAERIITMAEREQEHRISFDKREQSAAIRKYGIGQWLGWITVMACLGGTVYTATIGAHPAVSLGLVSVPIAAVIKQFLMRRSVR